MTGVVFHDSTFTVDPISVSHLLSKYYNALFYFESVGVSRLRQVASLGEDSILILRDFPADRCTLAPNIKRLIFSSPERCFSTKKVGRNSTISIRNVEKRNLDESIFDQFSDTSLNNFSQKSRGVSAEKPTYSDGARRILSTSIKNGLNLIFLITALVYSSSIFSEVTLEKKSIKIRSHRSIWDIEKYTLDLYIFDRFKTKHSL